MPQQRKYWSAAVTRKSRALALPAGIFTWKDSKKIALALKHAAQASKRRKGTLYQSAMSMLNFYMNRAGKNLPAAQKRTLEQAKIEVKKLFKKHA